MGEKSRAFLEKNSEAILYKMGEKSRAFLEKKMGKDRSLKASVLKAFLYEMGEKSRAFLEKKSRAFLYKSICLSFILFSTPVSGDDCSFLRFLFQASLKFCLLKSSQKSITNGKSMA
jgi:hypothetical protein